MLEINRIDPPKSILDSFSLKVSVDNSSFGSIKANAIAKIDMAPKATTD
jgi:hypothetical protein